MSPGEDLFGRETPKGETQDETAAAAPEKDVAEGAEEEPLEAETQDETAAATPEKDGAEGAKEEPLEAETQDETAAAAPEEDVAELSTLQPLAWHTEQWRQVTEQLSEERLPHALLLRGGRGSGKEHFARALAARLLCLSPVSQLPCGACSGCRLLHFDNHPDLRVLRPEREAGQISIGQVRELLENFSTTAQRGGWRVAIFHPAEAMNIHAVNALLKSLEEPGAEEQFLLLSAQPERLPATVRSRCQALDFPPPPAGQVLPWLAEILPPGVSAEALLSAARGLPLAALQLHRDGTLARNLERITQWRDFCTGCLGVSELAAQWGDEQTRESLEWLIHWLLDARRLQVGCDVEQLRYQGRSEELRELGAALPAGTLHRVLQRSLQTLDRLQGVSNPDPVLALEELLFFCATLLSRETGASNAGESDRR